MGAKMGASMLAPYAVLAAKIHRGGTKLLLTG